MKSAAPMRWDVLLPSSRMRIVILPRLKDSPPLAGTKCIVSFGCAAISANVTSSMSASDATKVGCSGDVRC